MACGSNSGSSASRTTHTPVEPLCWCEEVLSAISHDVPRWQVFKFYAPWCRSCFSIKPLYERVARGPLSSRADFYEVDLGASRVLCTLANVAKLPVIHIYDTGGTLVDRRSANRHEHFQRTGSHVMGLLLCTALTVLVAAR